VLGSNARRSAVWIVALAGVAVACIPSPSDAPSSAASSLAPSAFVAVPSASASPPDSIAPSASEPSTAPSTIPGLQPTPTVPVVVPLESVQPYTPPPDMEPIDDATCLALATRGDVEAALGLDVGDITAEGTDPNTALTCTYPAAGGQLLIATMIGDGSAYQSELDVAISYGQEPVDVSVGDQAFYAARTAGAPQQVTFTKGPVLVRLWNQTSATIGRSEFVDLAQGVANAIHAEIPPAP
jgi:hypothetical protein